MSSPLTLDDMADADTGAPPDSAPPGSRQATPFAYTPQDLDKARAVLAWLREHEQTRAWLARKVRVSGSTLSQVLSCKYPSSPSSYLDQMLAVLQLETERLGDGPAGYVEGSVHKLVFVVCDRTRKHRTLGVVVGHVGVGKTRTLREHQVRRPQTLMVEANPLMTPGSLLVELLEQLGTVVPPGLDRKFQALVGALKGTNYLLLVDEAENMSGQALHYLRRIRDKACVGIVLVGTPKLHTLLNPEHGQFEQIRSRVSMWPATIKAIHRDDMDEMARAALTGDGAGGAGGPGSLTEVPDDVLDALWAYSAGSARVLMESLVPALREYGLGKLALSAKLVDGIASKVLFLKRQGAAQ